MDGNAVGVAAVDGDAEKASEGDLLRVEDPKHSVGRESAEGYFRRPRTQVLPDHTWGRF